MTNTKKVGSFPINSRILIKYKKDGTPKIKFGYPDKERQIKNLWASSGVFFISLALTALTIIVGYSFVYSMASLDYPDCIIHPVGGSSNVINGTNFTITRDTTSVIMACGKEGRGWIARWEINPLTFKGGWSIYEYPTPVFPMFLTALVFFVVYIGGIFGYGKLLSFFVHKTRFGKEKYPGWNKFIHDKHFSAEFKKCPDNLKIELPLFSNIYMDYLAEEEFADYLKEVEIREHDIKYIKSKTFFGFRIKKKTELVPNVYLWKAVFTFSKKPKTGKLVINFT